MTNFLDEDGLKTLWNELLKYAIPVPTKDDAGKILVVKENTDGTRYFAFQTFKDMIGFTDEASTVKASKTEDSVCEFYKRIFTLKDSVTKTGDTYKETDYTYEDKWVKETIS